MWTRRLGRFVRVANKPFAPPFRRLTSSPNNMSASVFKVALCQLLCTDDKATNMKTAADAITAGVNGGATLIVLPEMFNCPYSNASFAPYSEVVPDVAAAIDAALSPTTHRISALAKQHAVIIVGGSIPERDADGRLYNTAVVFDSDGAIIAKHRKVHLFDIDIPGKQVFRESDTLTAGNALTYFDCQYGRFGIGICYDIRFNEYAAALARAGCDALIYPGAFNVTTGPLHWELLARARAVDHQCFVLTCSPARNPSSSYQAWGHSMAVSPWGAVLATTEERADVVFATIDMSEVAAFRNAIPTRKQKRFDVYGVGGASK